MSFKTQEYVHRDDSGDVVSSVQVHTVNLDEDAPRDDNGNKRPLKVSTTGGDVEVHDGDVLIQASNPNYWDVLSTDAWEKTDYVSADSTVTSAPAVADEDEPE